MRRNETLRTCTARMTLHMSNICTVLDFQLWECDPEQRIMLRDVVDEHITMATFQIT